MLTRREMLIRTLQGSSLLAVGSVVPQFLVNTARAAETGKDNVLVVVEMTGGNDGLNTVIPYADDLYQKARPTLAFTKQQVVKVDDNIGLHPALRPLEPQLGQLAIVQGVGYPNPDRSHFESMDIWQSADPKRQIKTGWVGRSTPDLFDKRGSIPVMEIGGANRLPLALQGAAGGVVSINFKAQYQLSLGVDEDQKKTRRKLVEDLNNATEHDKDDLLQFVQRRQTQTYTTLDKLQEVLRARNRPGGNRFGPQNLLAEKLELVSSLINQGFGTRVFYVSIDGFDTHSGQAESHRKLLDELANGIANFFNNLKQTGNDKRVALMTFSEFGRRVYENGSKGTDHGSGSCLFVTGPAIKGGAVGKHPSLSELDSGDLKWHTDFRRVYATLLDQWLAVDSRAVLGGDKFEHLELIKTA
jgi:uncharacterized protein (DUF1501 family)